MNKMELNPVLEKLNIAPNAVVTPFCREEDGSSYDVWKVESAAGSAVLKKTSAEERTVYESFFNNIDGVPKVYGFAEHECQLYMLMEYVEGETLSNCTREKLVPTLDALIGMQERYWGNTELAGVGWTFEKRHAAREKRLPYMEDLEDAFRAYLEADRTVPRTLCNDDLLPFNVLVGGAQAVIIDWEFAGILPYPCALARLLAFGEYGTDFVFQMSPEDRLFALEYYYEHLVCRHGISRAEYERTMKLFFLKECTEWVYFARNSQDFSRPEYQKYYEKAKNLAKELGLYGQK